MRTADRASTEAGADSAARAGALRWLISGYYGAGNLGDEALLAGLLRALRARGAEHLAVLSLDPPSTARQHAVRTHHRLLGLAPALLRSDVLVSGGGGLLQDTTSTRSLRYYLSVITLARRLRRRVVVYGQSLGPLSDAGRERVRAALPAVPLGLRDDPSLALASTLGLRAHSVADAALLLSPPPERPRATLLLVPRGDQPLANEALATLARRALAEGASVEALAFHPRHDASACEALAAAVPGVRASVVTDPGAALEAMAGARLVVSVRLHGLILATLARAPHVALSYDPKVAGFAQRSGATCHQAPDSAAASDALATSLEAAWRSPRFDDAARAQLLDQAERGVDWLVWHALHGHAAATT